MRAWGLLLVVAALRVAAADGDPRRWPDTDGYEILDLAGRAPRPWTVPLLYRFVGSPEARVLAHGLLGAAAFTALAVVVGRRIRHRWVRVASMAALVGLGLTAQVTSYDGALLADSVAVSLSVGLVAAWAHFAHRPDRVAAAVVAATTLLWTCTRDVHLYLGVAVLLVAAAAAARSRLRRPWPALLAALVAISAYGFAVDGRNTETSDFNLAAVLAERVLPDDELRSWFEDHGLPRLDRKRLASGVGISEALHDPVLGPWVRGEGTATYRRFLLTHPGYVLTEPVGDLFAGQAPVLDDPTKDRVMLSPAATYGTSRRLLPPPIDGLLFAPGGTGALAIGLVVALVAVAVTRRGGGGDGRTAVALAVLGLSVPHVLLLWHGASFEHERHAMPLAVTVRVAVVVLLAVAADRALSLRGDAVGGGAEGGDHVGDHLVGEGRRDLEAVDDAPLREGAEQEGEGDVEVDVATDLATELGQLEHGADGAAPLLEHRHEEAVEVIVAVAGGEQRR